MSVWKDKTTPPHNRDAEEAVIGSVMINPDIFVELSAFLKPDDFYLLRHRWIWQALTALDARHVPIDYLIVNDEIKRIGRLEDIGGTSYITELLVRVPTSLNAVSYAKIVESESIRRKLIAGATSVAQLALNYDKPIDTIVADAQSAIQSATDFTSKRELTLSELTDEHKVAIVNNSKGEGGGILWGLTDLDKLFGFGYSNKLIVLGGRPGVGKTSLGIQGAIEAAKQGKIVAVFTMEMEADEIVDVMLSMMSGIDGQRLSKGKLTDKEWETYDAARLALSSLKDNLIIIHKSSMSVQEIRAKCMTIKSQRGGLDLIVIDYLMRIKGYSSLDANDRANMITLDLADMRDELKASVLLIHHMNRGIEHRADNKPVLADLTEGGERDPDIVMMLSRDKNDVVSVTGFSQILASIVKHRRGPIGEALLLFKGECQTFVNGPKHGSVFRKGGT